MGVVCRRMGGVGWGVEMLTLVLKLIWYCNRKLRS